MFAQFMRSIQARFKEEKRKAACHGDFICLGRAVEGRRFCAERISRNLTALVEKDDYSITDRPALLRHLVALSNRARRTEND